MFRMTGAFCLALALHFAFFKIPAPAEQQVLPAKAPKVQSISLQLTYAKAPSPKIRKKKTLKKAPAKKIRKETPPPPHRPLPEQTEKKSKPIPTQKKTQKARSIKQAPIPKPAPRREPPPPLTEVLLKTPAVTPPPLFQTKKGQEKKELVPPKLGKKRQEMVPNQKKLPSPMPVESKTAPAIPAFVDKVIMPPKTEFQPLSPPIPSENIRIAAMQRPRYPRAARRQGREGTVQIKVEILADGSLAHLEIYKSSHSEDLDQAAIKAVRQWSFRPATQDGSAVSQTAVFPVRFTLQ